MLTHWALESRLVSEAERAVPRIAPSTQLYPLAWFVS